MALAVNLSEKKRVPKTYVCSPLPIAQCRMSSLIDILVALSILLGYSVTTASFVTYVVREHQNKAKQLQHISGIGVTCYWVTNFIYDMVSNLCLCKKDRTDLGRRQFYIWDLFALVCSDYCHKDNKWRKKLHQAYIRPAVGRKRNPPALPLSPWSEDLLYQIPQDIC